MPTQRVNEEQQTDPVDESPATTVNEQNASQHQLDGTAWDGPGNSVEETDRTGQEKRNSFSNVPVAVDSALVARNVADSEYACDRQTVRSLASLIAADDRARVECWLTKLDESDDLEVRWLYMKYLLRVVSYGHAQAEPFRHLPFDGPLRRLNEVVDSDLLFGLTRETAPEDSAASRPTPITRVNRTTFYGRQPIPEDGLYCFAAAFSSID